MKADELERLQEGVACDTEASSEVNNLFTVYPNLFILDSPVEPGADRPSHSTKARGVPSHATLASSTSLAAQLLVLSQAGKGQTCY